MGKKNKKKGRGIEKTAIKTEKKLIAKHKKHLAEIGEDDIEKILAQIEEEEKKKNEIQEVVIEKPVRRANFSFISHPLKDELFLFGGEFFNGQKTVVYNDLINFNIIKKEWTIIQAPNAPPPRCGHQMTAVPKEKGQLWLFGGEFTSPTQNQFYHYKDLWVYHIGEKRWEKIIASGGPSPRSGHRMVLIKNQIIVFGGYYDNLKDYKYFNDLYSFDLENYKWNKLEPTGTPPSPRSGCQMVPLNDGKIIIVGGYRKEKVKTKDVDKGLVLTDMFLLSPEKNDVTNKKWKWVFVKQGGIVPTPRSGCSIVAAPGNKAFSFGGVFDEVESEEDICGTFYNDLNMLDLEKRSWRPVSLSGKKCLNQIKRKRRKIKNPENIDEVDDEEMDEDDLEEDKTLATTKVVTDGVFTMTVGPSFTHFENGDYSVESEKSNIFSPSPRMNCGMAIKNGEMYLYGGLFEEEDKQFTFADMYSLDLHKLDEWKIILRDDEATKEWIASESESEQDDDDVDVDDNDNDDDDDDDDEDEDDNDNADNEEAKNDNEAEEIKSYEKMDIN